jgi:hypothetical protein
MKQCFAAADANVARNTEENASALRDLVYKRMVEGLSLILASPTGRNLTDEFLREIFEQFLANRKKVLQ